MGCAGEVLACESCNRTGATKKVTGLGGRRVILHWPLAPRGTKAGHHVPHGEAGPDLLRRHGSAKTLKR